LCKCAACLGEEDRAKDDCKFFDVDDSARQLLHAWSLYVEEGHTPLNTLPLWVAEVGAMVRDFRTRKELKALIDTDEKRKARELLKAHGLVK